MLIGLISLIGLGLGGFSCATAQDQSPSSEASSAPNPLGACPITTLGETPEDCPWAAVARDLVKTINSGGDVKKKLEDDLPILVSRFQADRERSDWLKLWGRSVNFDDLAHGIIVQPEIIEALAAELGTTAPEVDGAQHVVPAAVNHTYGYLFSLLQTAYGYKRLRWTHPTLDVAFGFNEPTLAPIPTEGTLFGNATYFGGRIAFRGDGERLAALRAHENTVPERLRNYDYAKLQVTRLEETVKLKPGKVTLITDLVAFPNTVLSDGNSYLLVYSVASPKTQGPVLISMFPVAASFVSIALDPKQLGGNKTIISRYNAYVEGLTGHKFKGERKVTQ